MNIDDASFQIRASAVLAKARAIADEVETWADFSNAIFAPGGIACVEFTTRDEREAWVRTWQCKTVHRIQRQLADWMDKAEWKCSAIDVADLRRIADRLERIDASDCRNYVTSRSSGPTPVKDWPLIGDEKRFDL